MYTKKKFKIIILSSPQAPIFARSALYFRETLHRTTDSVRSVPSVPSVRIFEEILYGGSEVVHNAVVKYGIFGRFWREPKKYPCKGRIKSSSICVTRSPVLDVFFCTFFDFFLIIVSEGNGASRPCRHGAPGIVFVTL